MLHPASFSFSCSTAWRVLPLSFLLLGAATPAVYASQGSGPEVEVRDGFFLVLDTCTREQKLHFLPIVKTTPPEVSDYLKQISVAADETIKTIHHLQETDGSLRTEKSPLPVIEQKARKLFIGAAQQNVIFGTKGPDYVRALLVDQIQESVYIGSVARVTSDADTDTDRAKTVSKIANRWLKLRDRGYHLLNEVK